MQTKFIWLLVVYCYLLSSSFWILVMNRILVVSVGQLNRVWKYGHYIIQWVIIFFYRTVSQLLFWLCLTRLSPSAHEFCDRNWVFCLGPLLVIYIFLASYAPIFHFRCLRLGLNKCYTFSPLRVQQFYVSMVLSFWILISLSSIGVSWVSEKPFSSWFCYRGFWPFGCHSRFLSSPQPNPHTPHMGNIHMQYFILCRWNNDTCAHAIRLCDNLF